MRPLVPEQPTKITIRTFKTKKNPPNRTPRIIRTTKSFIALNKPIPEHKLQVTFKRIRNIPNHWDEFIFPIKDIATKLGTNAQNSHKNFRPE
jgi:hypothetical protein